MDIGRLFQTLHFKNEKDEITSLLLDLIVVALGKGNNC